MKKTMYINLVLAAESSENIEQLPVISIIDNGGTKYITRGLEEVAAAITEMAEYLGQDHSELRPFALERIDGSESTSSSTTPRQRRKRKGIA